MRALAEIIRNHYPEREALNYASLRHAAFKSGLLRLGMIVPPERARELEDKFLLIGPGYSEVWFIPVLVDHREVEGFSSSAHYKRVLENMRKARQERFWNGKVLAWMLVNYALWKKLYKR